MWGLSLFLCCNMLIDYQSWNPFWRGSAAFCLRHLALSLQDVQLVPTRPNVDWNSSFTSRSHWQQSGKPTCKMPQRSACIHLVHENVIQNEFSLSLLAVEVHIQSMMSWYIVQRQARFVCDTVWALTWTQGKPCELSQQCCRMVCIAVMVSLCCEVWVLCSRRMVCRRQGIAMLKHMSSWWLSHAFSSLHVTVTPTSTLPSIAHCQRLTSQCRD